MCLPKSRCGHSFANKHWSLLPPWRLGRLRAPEAKAWRVRRDRSSRAVSTTAAYWPCRRVPSRKSRRFNSSSGRRKWRLVIGLPTGGRASHFLNVLPLAYPDLGKRPAPGGRQATLKPTTLNRISAEVAAVTARALRRGTQGASFRIRSPSCSPGGRFAYATGTWRRPRSTRRAARR